ncbi:MAG TPA: HD domain-containing phosphohydrolase [Bdellovibrionales bacterium]|nr:HD domain-containing phosphohydrolase [Bdellovibrionales bacterium]
MRTYADKILMGQEPQDAVEMVAIPVKEFISASKLTADIFVRLGDRFVQIARAGDTVAVERLMVYESKKVDYLYVRKSDYSTYVDKNLAIAGVLINRSELDVSRKNGFVTAISHSVLQEMEDLGFTSETFEHARAVTKITVDLIEAKPAFRDLFAALNNCSNETLAHSVAVSMVAVMLGQALGWTQQSVLEKLALGGLLHDIGMKELPPTLLKKPRAEMSFSELREYETHCDRGVKILQSLGIVPDDVICIVLEHHELAAGQGFPKRLKSVRIHPLARVVGLANYFCELTVKNRNSGRVRTPAEAVAYIEKTASKHYNKELMSALIATFSPQESKKAG